MTTLVGRRRRLWRRSLVGGVVLEAMLVADGIGVAWSWWWSSALLGELLLLCLASPYLVHLVRVASVQVVFWRILCHPSSVADALPLLFSGGYFAAVVELVVDRFEWMLCHLGWLVGGCFATFEFGDCLLSRRWCIFSRLRNLVVPGFPGSYEFPSPVLLAALVLCWGRLPLAWWCVVIALIASVY